MSGRLRVSTSTSQVFEFLVREDDLFTREVIQSRLGLDVNHTSAALSYLYKRHAVDVVESEGSEWWFATPEDDDRSRTVSERRPERRRRVRRCGYRRTDYRRDGRSRD